MVATSEGRDAVAVSSVGITRALVSAGMPLQHAQAAAHLFMPYLQAQEQAESIPFKGFGAPGRSRSGIARKQVPATLAALDKELNRLFERVKTEEQCLNAGQTRRFALLKMLQGEHQERQDKQFVSHPDMHIRYSDA